jgi:hypothetical protein
LGLTVNQYFEAQSDEEIQEEEDEEIMYDYLDMGRCATTGY